MVKKSTRDLIEELFEFEKKNLIKKINEGRKWWQGKFGISDYETELAKNFFVRGFNSGVKYAIKKLKD